MSEPDETIELGETNGISRRTALKTGAALGVGVAAWGGPQIGRMGAAPAYAADCTPGQFTTFTGQDRNSSFNCGSPPAEKCIDYKADAQSFTYEGASVSFSTAGGCSETGVSYTLTGAPAGSDCQPVVTVFEQGGTSQTFPPSPSALPALCEPALSFTGSIFVRIDLQCGPSDCFH